MSVVNIEKVLQKVLVEVKYKKIYELQIFNYIQIINLYTNRGK